MYDMSSSKYDENIHQWQDAKFARSKHKSDYYNNK